MRIKRGLFIFVFIGLLLSLPASSQSQNNYCDDISQDICLSWATTSWSGVFASAVDCAETLPSNFPHNYLSTGLFSPMMSDKNLTSISEFYVGDTVRYLTYLFVDGDYSHTINPDMSIGSSEATMKIDVLTDCGDINGWDGECTVTNTYCAIPSGPITLDLNDGWNAIFVKANDVWTGDKFYASSAEMLSNSNKVLFMGAQAKSDFDGDYSEPFCQRFGGVWNNLVQTGSQCCGDDGESDKGQYGEYSCVNNSAGEYEWKLFLEEGGLCDQAGGDYQGPMPTDISASNGLDGCCGDDPFYDDGVVATKDYTDINGGVVSLSTYACPSDEPCLSTSSYVETSSDYKWLSVETLEPASETPCSGIEVSCHNMNGEEYPDWGPSSVSCKDTTLPSSCSYIVHCLYELPVSECPFEEGCREFYNVWLTNEEGPATKLYDSPFDACNRGLGTTNHICGEWTRDYIGWWEIHMEPTSCDFTEGDKHFFNSNSNYFCSNDYNSTLDDPKIDSNPPAEWHWWDATQDAFTIHTIGG